MPQGWTLDTAEKRDNFMAQVCQMVQAGKKPVVQFIEHQNHRSLDQNALFQKWAREYACHLLNKDKVSKEEHEAMKYTLQRQCYAQMGWDYLLARRTDLMTGEQKVERRSTTDFDVGEMYQFMNWIQASAAERGLILESLGEYQELQRREVA